jgi:hypothetical protein
MDILKLKRWGVLTARLAIVMASANFAVCSNELAAGSQSQEIERSNFLQYEGFSMNVRIVAAGQAIPRRVYVLIGVTNDPGIYMRDVKVQVFDRVGKQIPVTNTLPKDTHLPGTGRAGGNFYYAIFDISGGDLRLPRNVDVMYHGKTNHFELQKSEPPTTTSISAGQLMISMSDGTADQPKLGGLSPIRCSDRCCSEILSFTREIRLRHSVSKALPTLSWAMGNPVNPVKNSLPLRPHPLCAKLHDQRGVS